MESVGVDISLPRNANIARGACISVTRSTAVGVPHDKINFYAETGKNSPIARAPGVRGRLGMAGNRHGRPRSVSRMQCEGSRLMLSATRLEDPVRRTQSTNGSDMIRLVRRHAEQPRYQP